MATEQKTKTKNHRTAEEPIFQDRLTKGCCMMNRDRRKKKGIQAEGKTHVKTQVLTELQIVYYDYNIWALGDLEQGTNQVKVKKQA